MQKGIAEKAKAARHSLRNESEGGPATIVNMKYVYLLQSIHYPHQRYIGIADDVEARLAKHNEGGSIHTTKYKPWNLVAYFAFEDVAKAMSFERYLKSGSGRAFANKHLW